MKILNLLELILKSQQSLPKQNTSKNNFYFNKKQFAPTFKNRKTSKHWTWLVCFIKSNQIYIYIFCSYIETDNSTKNTLCKSLTYIKVGQAILHDKSSILLTLIADQQSILHDKSSILLTLIADQQSILHDKTSIMLTIMAEEVLEIILGE